MSLHKLNQIANRFTVVAVMLVCMAMQACESAPASKVEAVVEHKGQRFEIIEGKLYKVNPATGRRVFKENIYVPDYYKKNYKSINGKLYRLTKNGEKIPVFRTFSESFEDLKTVNDLIGPERGWTSMTLMGPRTPTIKDYVRLRGEILSGRSTFLDNRVEPSRTNVRSGKGALRLYSLPPSRNMKVAKASLVNELLHFKKHDHVWVSGWFYVEKGQPVSIIDFESSAYLKGAGMRILFSKDMRPRLELKWATKPTYNMPRGKRFHFPKNKWVHVKLHYYLSDKDDGLAEMWVDDVLLISEKGQTLPLANTVYDRIEVGITANPKGVETVLFVDDFAISEKEIR